MPPSLIHTCIHVIHTYMHTPTGLLPEITLSVAKAGALALAARTVGMFAYSQAPKMRQLAGIFHIGEFYIMYLIYTQTGFSFGWALEGLM